MYKVCKLGQTQLRHLQSPKTCRDKLNKEMLIKCTAQVHTRPHTCTHARTHTHTHTNKQTNTQARRKLHFVFVFHNKHGECLLLGQTSQSHGDKALTTFQAKTVAVQQEATAGASNWSWKVSWTEECLPEYIAPFTPPCIATHPEQLNNHFYYSGPLFYICREWKKWPPHTAQKQHTSLALVRSLQAGPVLNAATVSEAGAVRSLAGQSWCNKRCI